MNEPDNLDPKLSALLEGERNAADLSPEHHDALRARIEGALFAPPPPPASPPPLASSSAPLAKAVGLLVVGGILGAAIHAGLTPASPSQPSTPVSLASSSPAPPSPPPPIDVPGVSPADLPTAPLPRASVAPAPAASTAETPAVNDAGPPSTTETPARTQLAEERAIVERGRAALVRRDGVSALEALREHERRFPGGKLAEERDALLVEALATAGHSADALRKAREFYAKYPSSVFTPRVERSLSSIP